MRTRKLVVAVLIFFLHSGAQAQQKERSVLLPSSEANAVARFYSWTVPGRINGSWQPTKMDIESLERNLSQVSNLRATNWNSEIHINHPEEYFRQYVAVLSAGKKLIFVNAFCEDIKNSSPSPDWRNHLEIIADGGTCVWHALYDPFTGKFSGLEINGRA